MSEELIAAIEYVNKNDGTQLDYADGEDGEEYAFTVVDGYFVSCAKLIAKWVESQTANKTSTK